MPKEVLEQLFDSPIKVRLLKLFLRNPGNAYTLAMAARKIRSQASPTGAQVRKLASIKLIQSRVKGRKKYYSVNPDFDFYEELRTLILKASPASKKKMVAKIRKLGRITLALISGVFTDTDNSRVDILLVGEGIKKQKLTNFMKDIEAEVGSEIDYVVITTKDFKYRYDMFDRFLRDVLEKPHEKLINKLRV